MAKYVNSVIILAFTGVFLTGVLLVQHYFPESNLGAFSCGGDIVNPCVAVSQSSFGSIFGIPLAAFGLFSYLFILFLMLIADFSKNKYYHFAVAIVLPVSTVAVAIDVALFITLMVMGTYCKLCIATYIINILIMIISLLWYQNLNKNEKFTFMAVYRELSSMKDDSSNKKAALASFSIFVFLLMFAVFSISNILNLKSDNVPVHQEDIKNFVQGFYSSPAENIEFPASSLILGPDDASVTIHAFTDFLCSACYEFYKVEKYLMSKFKNRIRVVYYNFPLDKECNEKMPRSVYQNSCVASRAMIAAAANGNFTGYLVNHFNNYQKHHENYTLDSALFGVPQNIDKNRFKEAMDSPSSQEMIKSHIDFAEKLGIRSTPTIFISGRRIVGVAPKEMMEAVIRKEIEKSGR